MTEIFRRKPSNLKMGHERAGFGHYDEFTWRAGLDRLLVGVTMTEEGHRLFEGVLPVDDVESLEGNILVHGSHQLVQGLFERKLVDEVRLVLYPTAVGAGKKLFEVPAEFTLGAAEPSEQVVLLTYRS